MSDGKKTKKAPSEAFPIQLPVVDFSILGPPCQMCGDTGANALNNGEPCVCQIGRKKD
ncbi:MAG: hypothetical protein WCT08_03500 [Patescibacteria group bacterium]